MDENTKLLADAAKSKNIEGMRDALAAGADFNDHKVLRNAIMSGEREVVQLVVDAGVDLSSHASLAASASGRTSEYFSWLCSLGMSADGADKFGRSALIRASESLNIDLVRHLLESGASVDAVDDDGWSALAWASDKDKRWNAVVEPLLEHGADINLVTPEGWSPFLLACHNKVVDDGPVRIMLEADALDINRAIQPFGWTPLLKACAGEYACEGIINLLIERAANVNAEIKVEPGRLPQPKGSTYAKNMYGELKISPKLNGTTPLMFALKKGRGKIAKLLCEAGANVHAQTADGKPVESFAKSKKARELLACYA